MTTDKERKMKLLREILTSTALLSASFLTPLAQAADHGRVLVILSSSQQLELRDGKTYRTGYYLDELEIPLRKIIDAEQIEANGGRLVSKIWKLFSNKDYKTCYCRDPWGTVIELNSHPYVQIWSNLQEPPIH